MYSRGMPAGNAYRQRDLDDRRVHQGRFSSSRGTQRTTYTLSSLDYLKLLVLGGLCVLPVFGAVCAWHNGDERWKFLVVYLGMSYFSWCRYRQDKHQAVHHLWRTSEGELHILASLGGWPGALVAQHLLRHKIYKVKFQMIFWTIVAMHQRWWWTTYSHDFSLFFYQENVSYSS